MKIAVSIPDELFQQAERLAARTGSSRSHLYARALASYIEQVGDDPVTAGLDEIADEIDTSPAPLVDSAGKRLIEEGYWEW